MRDEHLEIPTHRVAKPPAQVLSRYRHEAETFLDQNDRFDWPLHCFEVADRDDPWEEVELCRAIARREPENPRHLLHMADAFVSAGWVELAVRLLSHAHRRQPNCLETSSLLLQLMFHQGKTEHDFAWIRTPIVYHLDVTTRQKICKHLMDNEGVADLFDLQFDLFDQEFCNFSLDELAQDLERDARFEVDRSDPHCTWVQLADRLGDP